MGTWYNVARIGDLQEGEARTVRVHGERIALFLNQGQFYAIEDMCPHMGASLARGYVEDGAVACPLHYWRFRLADGAWADNPTLKIASYPVRIEGDRIQIERPDPPAKELTSS